MTTADIDEAEIAVRERIWAQLEAAGVVPEPGVHGRIPDFIGAARAAERLADLPLWGNARVIKAVPDRAQQPVRALALEAGRLVYMAVPKLADELPFYSAREAAAIHFPGH